MKVQSYGEYRHYVDNLLYLALENMTTCSQMYMRNSKGSGANTILS